HPASPYLYTLSLHDALPILAVAAEVAKARKHVYTEKPIASTLEEGLEIAALEKKYGITVTVGHSARLMGGIRKIREAIDRGELRSEEHTSELQSRFDLVCRL